MFSQVFDVDDHGEARGQEVRAEHGQVILADGKTHIKACHPNATNESLIIRVDYDDEEAADAVRTLKMYFRPSSGSGARANRTTAVLTWGDVVRSSDVFAGDSDQHAIVTDADMVKKLWHKLDDWVKQMEVVKKRGRGGGRALEAEEVDDSNMGSSIMVENGKTYVLMAQGKDSEPKKVFLFRGSFVAITGTYKLGGCEGEAGDAVYEVLIELSGSSHAEDDLFVARDCKKVDDNIFRRFKRVQIPFSFKIGELMNISELKKRLAECYPDMGLALSGKFTVHYLQDILCSLYAKFRDQGKSVLMGIDSFGFQQDNPRGETVFAYANLVINVTTGEVQTHEDAGYKFLPNSFTEQGVSRNFYPRICPLECPVLRLRVLRTYVHIAKQFTKINFQTFMTCFAAYMVAPKFETIQEAGMAAPSF